MGVQRGRGSQAWLLSHRSGTWCNRGTPAERWHSRKNQVQKGSCVGVIVKSSSFKQLNSLAHVDASIHLAEQPSAVCYSFSPLCQKSRACDAGAPESPKALSWASPGRECRNFVWTLQRVQVQKTLESLWRHKQWESRQVPWRELCTHRPGNSFGGSTALEESFIDFMVICYILGLLPLS